MAAERYVLCTIASGMFVNECYVTVEGQPVSSAYVNATNVVRLIGASGQVRAYVIKEDDKGALVELPGEAVVAGLRTWVPKELLR